ncbi:unnamed protein product [Peronospora belbahrii]|uniref:Uncharacterized protein n=1 Tax=Peronospora belbahrii TaxID=622444 RepID=A0AAU9KY09_9STRA|nr:unnamed protein product [Peronospora belbahrii]CAH0515341.1 unnamed protein product [Peronospora belbahrii]
MASSSMSDHVNPLQERAAAAAQVLLAPGRSVSQREIQAMLEKNEAALKSWNALHKQQPAKTSTTEHNEWVRRCVNLRQQIGARLEMLASLADKQIAQEDEKNDAQKTVATLSIGRRTETLQKSKLVVQGAAVSHIQPQATSDALQQMYTPPEISTMLMGPTSTLVSMSMPNMTAPTPPTLFPEPPMPTLGFDSASSSMFYPTGQTNSMQTSTGFTLTTSMAVSGVTTPTRGYAMSSDVQTFTPNTYMTSSDRLPSASPGFMNQQDYMMGGGMMNPQQQQFMPMRMPMNVDSSGGGNMYVNNTYGMPSAPTSANIYSSGNGNSNNSNFPVDPFITPYEFTSDASFGTSGFPMAGMAGMPMHHQQHQVMGSMNGANYGAPMMPNNFGYGPSIGMPSSSTQSIMPQSVPTHHYQSTHQPFQQPSQLHQFPTQQIVIEPVGLFPDSTLYGDNTVNIFEGLTDDAFFPMQ